MLFFSMFIVGLLFGSFGSVILHRLGEHITRAKVRSILVGRSHCPHCAHTLARYDLFPLVSWLFTGWKCRYCNAKISHWYPLLELGSGLIFLGITYWRTLYGGGDIATLIISLFLHWSLYLLLAYDIQTMYLHPVAFCMSAVWALALLFYKTRGEMFFSAAQWIVVFAIGFFLFYRLAKVYVWYRRKQRAEGIGQGDVILAPIVWAVLWKVVYLTGMANPWSWMMAIQSFRYYVITACVASLLLLLIIPIAKEEGKPAIPFFPGMILGLWIMMMISPYFLRTFQ